MDNLNFPRGCARRGERWDWAIRVVRRGGELGREGEGVDRVTTRGGMRRALELRHVGRRG